MILFRAVEGVLLNLGIEVDPDEWTLSSILVILSGDHQLNIRRDARLGSHVG